MNLNTYRAHYSSLDFTKRLIKLKKVFANIKLLINI